MTATERLRALLDERGVEYKLTAWSCGAAVWWRDSSGTMWRAHDNEEDELLSFYAYNSVTPEQAIAATLGDEDTYTREDVESAFVSGYSLGCLPVGSDPQWDENRQTVDEHMAEWGWVRKEAATLDSCNCSNNCTNSERTGTCHDVGDPSDFCCSECGVRMFTEANDTYTMIASDERTIIKRPNYCPNCGRKVVDE